MINKNVKFCECCGQPIIDYRVTLTKRNLIWLYALGWLGKSKYSDTGYWVNYKEVHELVAKNFGREINGKWKPMVISGYSKMADKPWELIENSDIDKEKWKSRGDWRLTSKGISFINNKIQVPEIARFKFDGCYSTSRLIYAHEVKGVNFNDLTDLFNSF